MAEKKPVLLIVGGGVSGLAAGVYAQKSGFDSLLLERHSVVGGECTGWNRQGFHIDNCVHWMTGTSPAKELYRVWCEVGALGPDVEVIQNESFMHIDGPEGGSMEVWHDLNRLKEDLLRLFPEDRREIRHFVRAIRGYQDIEVYTKPFEEFTFRDNLRSLWQLRRVIIPHIRFASLSVSQYVKRIHSPLLRRFILSYLPEVYYVEAILYMYATFVSGNGGIPRGGSLSMAQRMRSRYESLGGRVRTNAEVQRIVVEDGRVRGVELRGGERLEADYVVAACDAHVTFSRLLPSELMDDYFSTRYKQKMDYPVFSSLNFYFGCDDVLDDMPDMVSFSVRPYEVCGHQQSLLFFKQFGYEPGFAPEGKTVVQILTVQYAADFDYWQRLHEADVQMYRDEKLRVAEEVRQRVEEHFPRLQGKLRVVEVVTPYSFYRYCGAYKGAYMSFIRTPQVQKAHHDGRVKGARGLYLAGQWLQMPGGLPNAVVTGKFAIQRICRDFGLPFRE